MSRQPDLTPARLDPPQRAAAVHATFRFYEELNDFLPPERRRREFAAP